MEVPPAEVHAPGMSARSSRPLLVVFASPIPIGASHEWKREEVCIE
ncbi:MAG TPA: hypothetical protein VFV63_18435 [Ilumatobacteraceae bacterium]|nr:hypothetical protein [Ilumatobacteraceae bacterium]